MGRPSIHHSSDPTCCVVPGGNFPTLKWIEPWERQFQKPVVTTNQAALWAMMGVMAITAPLAGFGRLLEELPVG